MTKKELLDFIKDYPDDTEIIVDTQIAVVDVISVEEERDHAGKKVIELTTELDTGEYERI